MGKIFVKLVSSRGSWEENGKVLGAGSDEGFFVEESDRVKGALAANVLQRVREEDVPKDETKKRKSTGPETTSPSGES